MNSLNLRKRELLLESELNRQVFQLELQQIRNRVSDFKGGILHSRWRLLAPVAGLLVAWKFRGVSKFLKSGVGLFALRKIWEMITAWSRTRDSAAAR